MTKQACRDRIERMLEQLSARELLSCYLLLRAINDGKIYATDKKKPAGAATPTSNKQKSASVLYTKGA